MGREEVDIHRLHHESRLTQMHWPTPYSSQLLFITHLSLSLFSHPPRPPPVSCSLSLFLHFFLPFPLDDALLPLSSICMHNTLFVHMQLHIHVGEVAIIKAYLTLCTANTPVCRFNKKKVRHFLTLNDKKPSRDDGFYSLLLCVQHRLHVQLLHFNPTSCWRQ